MGLSTPFSAQKACLPACQGQSQVPRRKPYLGPHGSERGTVQTFLSFICWLVPCVWRVLVGINHRQSRCSKGPSSLLGTQICKREVSRCWASGLTHSGPSRKESRRKQTRAKSPQRAFGKPTYTSRFPDFASLSVFGVMLSLNRWNLPGENFSLFLKNIHQNYTLKALEVFFSDFMTFARYITLQ